MTPVRRLATPPPLSPDTSPDLRTPAPVDEGSFNVFSVRFRAARHWQNAGVIANYLAGHPQVHPVNYSGLASSPSHALATELPTAHSWLTAEEQEPRGVEPPLVQLSVGLEDVGDLGAGLAVAR